MVELLPMLLSEVDDESVLDRKDRYFQLKYNGTRNFVHVKDGVIKGIRNRSNAPVLSIYEELRDHPVKGVNTAVLDCEICVFKDGKSIYYGGIDQRRSSPGGKDLKENPVTIVVFDALAIDGETLIFKPYKYRYQTIINKIVPDDKLIIAKNYTDGRELWNLVREKDYEGLVVKNPESIYELGARSKENYTKLKNYKFAEVIVEKTEPNSKGTKIFGKTTVNGKDMIVEAQIQNSFNIAVGDVRKIRYLEIIGNRLTQPTNHN